MVGLAVQRPTAMAPAVEQMFRHIVEFCQHPTGTLISIARNGLQVQQAVFFVSGPNCTLHRVERYGILLKTKMGEEDRHDETTRFLQGAGRLRPPAALAAPLPRAAAAQSTTVGRAVPDGNYTMRFRSELSLDDLPRDYHYSESLFDHSGL